MIVGAFEISDRSPDVVIEVEGVHYPKDVILFAVFFCVRYAVSYRDLGEILADGRDSE